MASKAFQKIMGGLLDARRHAMGDDAHGETTVVKTAAPIDIVALRKRLGLTQQEFADGFEINVATLRNWEQKRRLPDGPALALLRVIDHDPKAAIKALWSRK